jgi:hypothetical protein
MQPQRYSYNGKYRYHSTVIGGLLTFEAVVILRRKPA